jgi:hypothetical protein
MQKGVLQRGISRTFAIRMSKYMDKPVSQTGYSTTRRCQEVLATIVDCINETEIKNKKNGIGYLDIKKAFNSKSHCYLNKVYKFFNFRPNITKWLNTLGTGRQACLILRFFRPRMRQFTGRHNFSVLLQLRVSNSTN